MDDNKIRCSWCLGNELYIRYHDEEWGVPVHDDQKLFEFLTLEGAQAGLNWLTILKRRSGYRKAFANFDIASVAAFGEKEYDELLLDENIIRNRQKVRSTMINAQKTLEIIDEFGSFNTYLWQFVKNRPITHSFQTIHDLPAKNEISTAMSKELLKRGLKFVGPTICYALMQAIGMINDHTLNCYRHNEIADMDIK